MQAAKRVTGSGIQSKTTSCQQLCNGNRKVPRLQAPIFYASCEALDLALDIVMKNEMAYSKTKWHIQINCLGNRVIFPVLLLFILSSVAKRWWQQLTLLLPQQQLASPMVRGADKGNIISFFWQTRQGKVLSVLMNDLHHKMQKMQSCEISMKTKQQ